MRGEPSNLNGLTNQNVFLTHVMNRTVWLLAGDLARCGSGTQALLICVSAIFNIWLPQVLAKEKEGGAGILPYLLNKLARFLLVRTNHLTLSRSKGTWEM